MRLGKSVRGAVAIAIGHWLLGCGGDASKKGAPDPASLGGGGAATGGGGAAAGGGGTTRAGAAGGGQERDDHVPEEEFPYDSEYLEEGSFEAVPGFGWDTCYTKTPGKVRSRASSGSTGDRFLEIQSSSCDAPCSTSHTSESQFYVWFVEGKEPPRAAGLYLDLINLSAPTASNGSFTAYAVDPGCQTLRPLIEVPLGDLSLTGDWSTRCFEVALEPDEWLGFAVAGSAFDLGLDGLRLGPSCK